MDILRKVMGMLVLWFLFFAAGALNFILGAYSFVVIFMSMHEWTWSMAVDLWISVACDMGCYQRRTESLKRNII